MQVVVPLPRGELDDGWKRRLAVQLAAQLPEKPADALAVLALAETLVKTFLAPGGA